MGFVIISLLLSLTYFGIATYYDWWEDREFPGMFNASALIPFFATVFWPLGIAVALIATPFVGLYFLIKYLKE